MRKSQGYENGIIPWDIGAWAVAAQMLHGRYPSGVHDYGQAADDISEVIYQESFQQNPGYFDLTTDKNSGWDPSYGNKDCYWFVLGSSGLIDAFDAAHVHTGEIPGLVGRLLDSQYESGAFSYCYGANPNDEDWQSTSCAVMSLARVDLPAHQEPINGACQWIASTQHTSGG